MKEGEIISCKLEGERVLVVEMKASRSTCVAQTETGCLFRSKFECTAMWCRQHN